jgi:hypothetical protein
MASAPLSLPARSRRHPARPGTLLLAILVALGSLTLMAASTLLTVAFTDYEAEALPSVDALLSGDLGGFFAHLPAYGGSLILRAPAALLAHGAGGGDLAVYRALAAPCLLAGAIFGVLLWSRLTGRASAVAAWIALAVVVANPVLLPALDTGHPEEYLGAILCAAGVIAALADRPVLTGLLLGAAGANKAWAILAVPPALLALQHGRARFLAVAGAVCAAVLAPAVLHGTQAVGSANDVAQQSGTIFQPWQWTWFLGDHGQLVQGLYGDKPGYRTAPGWLTSVGHLPVIAVPLALAAVTWLRGAGREQALLLLAFCFLLRCVIDPWDTAYYHLPFLMALAAHEVVARGRAPVATLLASLAVYGSTVVTRAWNVDLQAALYLLWSVPAVTGCALALFAPGRWAALTAGAAARAQTALPSLSRLLGAQPMTVSSLESPLSTSCPSSVTMTRSSMRTPTAPGT